MKREEQKPLPSEPRNANEESDPRIAALQQMAQGKIIGSEIVPRRRSSKRDRSHAVIDLKVKRHM